MVTTVSLGDERTALRDPLGDGISRYRPTSGNPLDGRPEDPDSSSLIAADSDASSTGESGCDVVELTVPADPAYLAVIRTATAGVGARLNLTVDEIEDLRIAVDEACVLLLDQQSHDTGQLRACFEVRSSGLQVVIHGPSLILPNDTNYAWVVLRALAGGVETGANEHGSWIRLRHDRAPIAPAATPRKADASAAARRHVVIRSER